MTSPLRGHPLVKQFNELKHYFRKYETDVSRTRIKNFRKFASIIEEAGYQIAFDFLGSVNFGQAITASDVDLVLYLKCNDHNDRECDNTSCTNVRQIKQLFLTTLVNEFSNIPYAVQIVDSINLAFLSRELEKQKKINNSAIVVRFAFYRATCRLVNQKLIRPYQSRLTQNKKLLQDIQPDLWNIFDGLAQSSSHNWSFSKYQERITEIGVALPPSIIRNIRSYLNHSHVLDRENG